MSPKTINDEELKVSSNIEHPDIEETADYCINFVVEIQPMKVFYHQEFNEDEMLSLSEKVGIYSFLEDDSEDVYHDSDGAPLL